MAQEPFIPSPQTETSVRQAFEDYIQSRKKQKEAEGQKWEAEPKYRTSLKLIEDAGIVLDNMSLKELNTEENIERVMTNERLLKGEKTVRGDVKFGKGNIRDLGNHLNTIFNNLRAGEANALASWNAKNKGRVNPFDDGTDKIPFSTLGFDLTERKPSGQIMTAPDAVMLKAFRDTLDDIQDIEVGRGKNKKTVPAKTIKAHMLITVLTGMRKPDINNFVSQIDPSEEQLKATDSVKTFLRSDDYSMVINNKGKLTVYALNPTLYSVLLDSANSSSGEKVFPSAGSIENNYIDILKQKLKEAGYPNIKQDVKGVLKNVDLTHNVLRKFAYSVVERIPEAEGGGTSNADALIQHKTRDRSIGETTYRAGTLGEFQTTKETTAQSAFIRRLLPETTTPAQFLEGQGFNPANFAQELYIESGSPEDFAKLAQRTKQTAIELSEYERYLKESIGLSDETLERVKRLAPNAETFKAFMSAYSDDGIIDEDEVKSALDTLDAQSQMTKVASEIETKPTVEQAQPAPSKHADFFKDSPDLTGTSKEELKRNAKDILTKGATKVAVGAATGGLGLFANIADAAADVALSPTELGYGGLDPTEKMRGMPTSDMSDEELFERMQAASSQRLSPDMAERTTALADIEANRKGFAARAFDAPAQMRAREANLTELDYTTPEQERMQLAKTLQDVDTSEAFTQQAKDARKKAYTDKMLKAAEERERTLEQASRLF